MDLETDVLIAEAAALRAAPADDMPGGENRPPSLDITARNDMRALLQKCLDPESPSGESGSKAVYLKVNLVWAVHPPDERGLVEANYLVDGQPMTAFVRGRELAYLVEGW